MKKTVLIIEDDQDIREALAELLEGEGYDVIPASHGQEGLEMLRIRSQAPNLILLDLMMPVMDGFEFREQQKADPELEKIPVVIMSADGHIQQKLERIGGIAYLKKPVDLDQVLDAVKNYCN